MKQPNNSMLIDMDNTSQLKKRKKIKTLIESQTNGNNNAVDMSQRSSAVVIREESPSPR